MHRGIPSRPVRPVPSTSFLALAAAAVLAGTLLPAGGCSRARYRQAADRDAYLLIEEKTDTPPAALPDYSIEINPASRMYSPFHPDRPPMPPDDPRSHEMMHWVDKKPGYPYWHVNGDTDVVENPEWMAFLRICEYNNGQPVVVIDSDYAVELALLHSDSYQNQLETLYLSALDVSAERFRFDTQFFAGGSVFYATRDSSPGGSSSTVEFDVFGRAQKLFATGAELTVGLANSIVWQFSGPDTRTATTLVDFSLVQPLLRNAGRDRVLETLTISERALLANVRQMERYRRGFYLQVVTGRNPGPGPNRRGGFFGGSGLGGFTGVGGGGFGQVGGFGGGGFGGGGAGAPAAGGFMGLLQTQMQIDNLEDNVNALRNNLRRLIDINEGAAPPAVSGQAAAAVVSGAVQAQQQAVNSQLQIAQARQALVNAESQLLRAQANYQSSLDDFKQTLGLPPQVCIKIDDPMFDDVNLIDRLIRVLQVELNTMMVNAGDAIACLRVQMENEVGNQAVTLEKLHALRRQLGEELHPANLEMLREAMIRDYDVCETWCPTNDRRPELNLAQLVALVVEGEESSVNRVSRDGARLAERLSQRLRGTNRERDQAIVAVIHRTLTEQHGRWPDVLGRWLTLDQGLSQAADMRNQMAGAASLDPALARPATLDAVERLDAALANPQEPFPADPALEVVTALEQEILLIRYARSMQDEIDTLECLFGAELRALAAVEQRLAALEQHQATLTAHRQRLVQAATAGRAGVEGARENLVEAAAALRVDLSFPLAETIAQMIAALENQALALQKELERLHPWLVEMIVWRNEVRDARVAGRDPCAAAASELETELELLKRLMVSLVDSIGQSHASFRAVQCRIERTQAAIVQLDRIAREIDMLLASGMAEQAAARREEFIRVFDTFISPAIPNTLSVMSDRVLDLSLVQAGARTELVEVVRVNLDPDTALEIARANRRDWMNARAALVDSWRLIEFNADNLESTLDVVFSGDVQAVGVSGPLTGPTTNNLRVGLEFDAPLTRLQERNTYRQALIEYNQARRDYYLFVDSVAATLREELRTLRLNNDNFRLRREALRVAREQILLNREIQTIQQENALSSGPTTARDAVSALADLLQAQNDFLDVYVNYEVLRRSLDFDLGTMMLRPDGVWIDPGPIGPESGPPTICVPCGPSGLPNPLEEVETPLPLRLPPAAPDVQRLPQPTPATLPAPPTNNVPTPPPGAAMAPSRLRTTMRDW